MVPTVIGRDNGLNIVQLVGGEVKHVTDGELAVLRGEAPEPVDVAPAATPEPEEPAGEEA